MFLERSTASREFSLARCGSRLSNVLISLSPTETVHHRVPDRAEAHEPALDRRLALDSAPRSVCTRPSPMFTESCKRHSLRSPQIMTSSAQESRCTSSNIRFALG